MFSTRTQIAEAAGYIIRDDGLTRFLHSPNRVAHLDGSVLDPSAPESIIYARTDGGKLVLVGALFKRERGWEGPDLGGSITQWHYHQTSVNGARTRCGGRRPFADSRLHRGETNCPGKSEPAGVKPLASC